MRSQLYMTSWRRSQLISQPNGRRWAMPLELKDHIQRIKYEITPLLIPMTAYREMFAHWLKNEECSVEITRQ